MRHPVTLSAPATEHLFAFNPNLGWVNLQNPRSKEWALALLWGCVVVVWWVGMLLWGVAGWRVGTVGVVVVFGGGGLGWLPEFLFWGEPTGVY